MNAPAKAALIGGIRVAGCAWCGRADGLYFIARVLPHARAMEQPKVYRVGCKSCGASTREEHEQPTREGAAGVWGRALPIGPMALVRELIKPELEESATRAAPRIASERFDVLEMLGRLLVGSSYKVPVEGRSSKPGLQPVDIAGALGMMQNPLRREVALAVAQREPALRSAPRLVRLAYARVAYVIQQHPDAPLDLRKPEDCHRLRIVIYDAAAELVFPEQKQPAGLLAKQAKMRKGSYLRAHKVATAELQAALNEGRHELGGRLFAQWQADL